jgi:hypothetical protein
VTIKEVSSVIDDINEWNGPNGTIYYVTAMFTDESVGSVGRKDHDAALEVQGLLREAIGIEQDFTLESKGQTKTGRDKFNIKGFGTPGGAATYTAPGVQGGGNESGRTVAAAARGRSPEQIDDIRRAVALKAAAQCVVGTSPEDVLKFADVFEAWLAKTSDASSAYTNDIPVSTPAGASEDRPQETRPLPADSAGLVGSGEGEALEPTPHQHDWQAHTNLHGWLACGCGENRKKYAP